MNRQSIFNHFMNTVNGKGRCYVAHSSGGHNGICLYAKDGHPGCAIGCQPQFKRAIEKLGINAKDVIGSLNTMKLDNGCEEYITKHVLEEFGTKGEDASFLRNLQILHDEADNWEGDSLIPEVVDIFKKKYELV